MKEDTTEFLLKLKELRLRSYSDRQGKLYLEAQGPGPVYASQIQATADYEIVNPDLELATLDSEDSHLTVELTVELGEGYLPAGSVTGMPIGVIPVDAIFTPVKRVNYFSERTRVGPDTNHDRLVVEVWTDGTISGVEAVAHSADILMAHFALFSQLGRPVAVSSDRGLGSASLLPPDRYNTPIEDLNLSVRAYNCLKRSGLMTVGQVLEKSEDELLSLRNFGRKSYDELRDKLVEMGFLEPSAITSSASRGAENGDEFADEDEEELGTLGAALMEALRGKGDNTGPSTMDFLRRGERDHEEE